MIEILMLIICAIILIYFQGDNYKSKSKIENLKEIYKISLQLLTTFLLFFVVMWFFSDFIEASDFQMESIGMMAILFSFVICHYVFRR